MAGRKLIGTADRSDGTDTIRAAAPLGGTRADALQRLQVGLAGLAGMILLVGLASIIQNRAQISEEGAVPEAAPTTQPTEAPAQRDPLADAGVVPDLPAEANQIQTQEPALVPEGTRAGTPEFGTDLPRNRQAEPKDE